jgi:glycosyltransferase involved in cell wall biosynthesis
MRILFLTNFYPPFEIGGQERSCQQVVEGLSRRGHQTLVLTSTHGTYDRPDIADNVHRRLYLEMDLTPWRHSVNFFTDRKRRERQNEETLNSLLSEFQPDIVFIWGMWNLSRTLPAIAEARLPDGVVYRFAEYWPSLPSQHEFYWRAPGRKWYSRPIKSALGRVAMAMLNRESKGPPLQFKNTVCVSSATRDKLVELGVPVTQAKIIHTGIEVNANGMQRQRLMAPRTMKLLYAGRFAVDKGIETAIYAMAELVKAQGRTSITLSLAGSGLVDYTAGLHQLVAELGLEQCVTFLGWVRHEDMPQLMQQHDALLVPSIWPEPFARAVLEGMAASLVIVATPNGGTKEIVIDGENGLLFPPGDSHALAATISRLADDPGLRHRLSDAGRQTITRGYTLDGMIDQYEDFLQGIHRVATPTANSIAPA